MHSSTDVDALACEMYASRVQERGPAWDQLGETTKSVWREAATTVLDHGGDVRAALDYAKFGDLA